MSLCELPMILLFVTYICYHVIQQWSYRDNINDTVKMDIYTIHTYVLLCCHNLTSTEKLLQGFFYSNRVINDSSQVFLCAVDMPLWFTNDSPQGQFSSRILNLLYKIKISEKDENQNNLWSLSCPSGICVRYLYNIGRCQNMFCFR